MTDTNTLLGWLNQFVTHRRIDEVMDEADYEAVQDMNTHLRAQEARITALTKVAEPVDIGYMQKVSEALYENGDPVSIDAAELLERISAPAPKAITASNVDADIEYWRQKYLKLDAMYDELEKEKIAIEQNLMDRT